MADTVIKFYNWGLERHGKESLMRGGGKKLKKVPTGKFNFDEAYNSVPWHGGTQYWCTSKSWLHRVRGMDESIRWYADLDLIRRASIDGLLTPKLHSTSTEHRIGQKVRSIHIRIHRKSRRLFGGSDVIEIARKGKRSIHKRTGRRDVIRNDEYWGILTPEKIRRAIQTSKSG